jgi:hypothetical protein
VYKKLNREGKEDFIPVFGPAFNIYVKHNLNLLLLEIMRSERKGLSNLTYVVKEIFKIRADETLEHHFKNFFMIGE